MLLRLESLTGIILWLIFGVLAAIVILSLASIQRRISRRRYFQELDRARERAQEAVDAVYQKKVELEGAIASFSGFRSKAERQALEDAVLRRTKSPEEAALAREILRRMGWMREWINTVRSRAKKPSGQAARLLAEAGDDYRPPALGQRLRLRLHAGFMKRAVAANKLAQVPSPEGKCALVAGVADPHPDVQEVCIRHLGKLAEPDVLPVLQEELVKVLEGRSRISARSIKTALIEFPLEKAEEFLPLLGSSNKRVRFFAVDILREMADRRAGRGALGRDDFAPSIYGLFTERLWRDEWGDVRARSAAVMAHFHDPACFPLLEKLAQDEAWFVRLHACRSLASPFFIPLATALVQRLTDTHWLVREAAARSLMAMGASGVAEMIRAFLTSADRFSVEQISEELQRSGLLIELLDAIEEPEQQEQTLLVVRKMISLGKMAVLLDYLIGFVPSIRKLLLIQELSVCQSPECRLRLEITAEQDLDPEVRAAAGNALQAARVHGRAPAPIMREI